MTLSALNTVQNANLEIAPHCEIEVTPFPSSENEEEEKIHWFKRTMIKVWKVVKWILKAIVGIALFLTSPSFFAIGFVVGLIFSKKVQEVIDKICLICKKQPWIVLIIGGLGGFLALPVTLATAALFFGSYLGAKLSNSAVTPKSHSETLEV